MDILLNDYMSWDETKVHVFNLSSRLPVPLSTSSRAFCFLAVQGLSQFPHDSLPLATGDYTTA